MYLRTPGQGSWVRSSEQFAPWFSAPSSKWQDLRLSSFMSLRCSQKGRAMVHINRSSGGHQFRLLGSWGVCSALLFCGHLGSVTSHPLLCTCVVLSRPTLPTFLWWWLVLQFWLRFGHLSSILLPLEPGWLLAAAKTLDKLTSLWLLIPTWKMVQILPLTLQVFLEYY